MDFKNFERDVRIKRQKDRIEARVRVTNREFRIPYLVQDFIYDRRVLASRLIGWRFGWVVTLN